MRRFVVLVGLLVGCGAPLEMGDGGFDAGAVSDAGLTDAGTLDAGVLDAGDVDAGSRDAGGPDAGAAPLTVAPTELVFSGVKGTTSAAQLVTVTNRPDLAVFARLSLTGALDFTVSPSIGSLVGVDGGATVALSVRFTPDASSVGVRAAHLGVGDAGLALWGLATTGEQGTNEPPLQSCFDALGFAIDAGSRNLIIGTTPQPVGDEVLRTLFHRAGAGAVTLRPIARYSPNETLPFGWYTALADGGVTLHPVGTIALGQEQTLNPGLTPDSGASFDPGAEAFGVYVHSNTFSRDTFTEDRRNTGPTVHAVRVYPVKNRAGASVPKAFVLAFEDAANGDYQDYVFELTNAGP